MTNKQIPIVNDPSILGNVCALTKAYQTHGPLFRVQLPGNGVMTVLAGPESNIFVRRDGAKYFSTFEFYRDMMAEFEPQHMAFVGLDGEQHYQIRRLFTPFFKRKALAQYVKSMAQTTVNFVQQWQQNQELQVVDWMLKLNYQQMGLAWVNSAPEEFGDDFVRFFRTVIDVTQKRVSPPESLQSPEYLNAKQRVYDFLQTLVRQRKKTGPLSDKPDMLDVMIEVTFEDGRSLTEEEVMGSLMMVFVAGIETVVLTSSFMLYEVLKHPKIYRQIVAEMEKGFAKGLPTLDDLENMRVLRGTMMETLRCHAQMILSRYVKNTFDFQSYTVESGQPLLVALGVAHQLPDLYPQPEVFDIDRFSPPRDEHKQPGAYAPFGFGAHICLGEKLAEIQLMLSLGIILYTCRPSLIDAEYTLPANRFDHSTFQDFYVRVLSK